MIKNKKGFTLMELLIVVLIIGILGAVALPQYMTAVVKTKISSSESVLTPIYNAIFLYHQANDKLPTSFKQLPVSLPENYTINGLSATATSGECSSITFSGGYGGVRPVLTMNCNAFSLKFYFILNNSTGVLKKEVKFVEAKSGYEKEVKKAAKSLGGGADGETTGSFVLP